MLYSTKHWSQMIAPIHQRAFIKDFRRIDDPNFIKHMVSLESLVFSSNYAVERPLAKERSQIR
jgi:hypothetical protein